MQKMFFSWLILVGLSGCASDATQTEEVNASNQEGELEKVDWLTAWSTPYDRSNRTFSFDRWSGQSPTGPSGEEISLWDTVGNQVSLVDWDEPRIQRAANFYARNQRFLDIISDRAAPYFHFVLDEIQKRSMPVELALLPIIESAYQPGATSSRRAAGLWQLIPGTARRWGVDLTRGYDGRRDVFASTNAALDYLQKLNDEFSGDWLLAMAAYNCGENGVERAIQRNLARGRPTDFWSLDLPSETRAFVPKILGLAAVISEPSSYGVQLKTLRDIPILPVRVDYPLDLERVAELAEVPLYQVEKLNPALRHGRTQEDGGHVLLPAEQAGLFEDRLAELDLQ